MMNEYASKFIEAYNTITKALNTFASTLPLTDTVVLYVINPVQQFLTLSEGIPDMSAWSAMFSAMESIKTRTQFIDVNELYNITPTSLRSLALRTYSVVRIGTRRWESPQESGEKLYGATVRLIPSPICQCDQDRNRHRHVALHMTYSITYIQSVEALEDPTLDGSSPDLSNCPMVVNAVFMDDSGELLETMALTSGDYHRRDGPSSTKTILEWCLNELHQQALQYMTAASNSRTLLLWDYVVSRTEGDLRDEEEKLWGKYIEEWSNRQRDRDRENHRDREYYRDDPRIKGTMHLTSISCESGMHVMNDNVDITQDGYDNALENDSAFIYVTPLRDIYARSQGYLVQKLGKSDYHVLDMRYYETKESADKEPEYYQKLLVRWLRQIYSLSWLQLSNEGPWQLSSAPIHLRMIRNAARISKLYIANKHAKWKVKQTSKVTQE
jgi:hypothetical protein